jgi:hypothetical protein
MKLDRDDWLRQVNHNLDLISAGASMAVRHCEALPVRPGFVTYAEDDLMLLESALREALVRVQFARALYAGLEVSA